MNATMTNMVENRSRHAVRDGFRNDMAERYLSVRSVQKRLRSGSAARHGVRGPAHCLAAFFVDLGEVGAVVDVRVYAVFTEFPDHHDPRSVLASARLGVIEDTEFVLAADRTVVLVPLQHGYLLSRDP